jgi:RNA polymerase primary sigma factor
MEYSDPGFRIYLDEIASNRVLTAEEERELFQRIEDGDDAARQEVVDCNLKFVIRIARRFLGRGLPLEDLVQEGNLGLLEAISRFDYRLGFRFSTYAAFWIRQAVQVGVRQRGSLVRIPVRKSRQLGFMSEVIQEYLSIRGRMPTEEEIGERLGISADDARELVRLGEAVLSLDATDDNDLLPLMEQLEDPRAVAADSATEEHELRDRVQSALTFLTDRENEVIRSRFGFGSGVGRSLRKVSRGMGLSQEGVRRIEQRALSKLRRPYVRQTLAGLI